MTDNSRKATNPRPPDPTFVFRAHNASVSTVAFHDSLPLLFSGSGDGEMRVWDINTKRCVHTVPPTVNRHESLLKVAPFGSNQILSQTRDGTISVWDLERLERTTTLNFESSFNTRSLSFCKFSTMASPFHGTLLALPGDDAAVINLWDTKNKTVVMTLGDALRSNNGLCMAIKFVKAPSMSPSLQDNPPPIALPTTTVASAIEEPILEDSVSTTTTPKSFLTEALRSSSTSSSSSSPHETADLQSWSNNSDTIAASFESGYLHFWNMRSSRMTSRLKAHNEPALCLDFDDDLGVGISGGADDHLAVFSLKTPEATVVKRVSVPKEGISDVQIRPDRKIFATAGWDHRVRIFGWKKHQPLAILKFHSKTVHSVAFCPHSPSLLATASEDTRIALYHIY